MKLKFEQPLNEKIRNYLRIEQVSRQLQIYAALDHPGAEFVFFRSLFELGDLCERGDLRRDLLQDISRHLHQINRWQYRPDVDKTKLEALQQQLTQLSQSLQNTPRFAHGLKQDRLLNNLRQRMQIPGGDCSFDLPQFHYWLAKPLPSKLEQIEIWMLPLQALIQGIEIRLTLLRTTATLHTGQIKKGSYKAEVAANVQLLTVELDTKLGVYPTMSAHRGRFSLNLIDHATGKNSQLETEFRYQLAMET